MSCCGCESQLFVHWLSWAAVRHCWVIQCVDTCWADVTAARSRPAAADTSCAASAVAACPCTNARIAQENVGAIPYPGTTSVGVPYALGTLDPAAQLNTDRVKQGCSVEESTSHSRKAEAGGPPA